MQDETWQQAAKAVRDLQKQNRCMRAQHRSPRACVFSRLGAMESISSMKMMAGAFFSASSNALRRLLSLSPASFDMISGPLIRKKNAPALNPHFGQHALN